MHDISINEMAASFEPQETVFLGGASGEAVELTSVLADPNAELADANFVTTFIPGVNPRCLARLGRRSRVSAFFMQPSLQNALREGRVDFRPTSFLGIHRFLCSVHIDTAVVQISTPDSRGNCSLGPCVEFFPSVISRATRMFGIINSSVPRLEGSISIPLDRFERIAHSSAPLATYDVGAASPASKRVVEHLAALIPSGVTLQVGLGKIPSQLLLALRDHRELGLHTGMISDSVLELAAAGALREREPICVAVALGSTEFYGRLAGTRQVSFAEVAYTHAPQVLAKVARLYAVNSAFEIDLLGQTNAEMLDGRYISGPGGLPDFARAAHLDPEGLSIIALNATDHRGTHSRIVAHLGAGTPVSVPQHDIDAVVTEFGVAMLRGQPVDERARRMCSIAHPDHRPILEQSIKTIFR